MNLLYGNEWVDKSTRVTTAEGYNFNFPGWNHIGNATTFQSGQSTTKNAQLETLPIFLYRGKACCILMLQSEMTSYPLCPVEIDHLHIRLCL